MRPKSKKREKTTLELTIEERVQKNREELRQAAIKLGWGTCETNPMKRVLVDKITRDEATTWMSEQVAEEYFDHIMFCTICKQKKGFCKDLHDKLNYELTRYTLSKP